MNERIDPQTGEVTNLPATVDTTMATAIAKAELDTRITTAHAFPRSTQMVVQSILSLATLNEKTAETMMYALPRGNKPIIGPSIRLAEIVSQCYGNCVSESRVVAIDKVNKIITAEGLFTDLQTNSTIKASVERRISDKHGRLYSDDMIAVTGNAARSIARRNAILAGVPKAIWEQAYEAAEHVVAGDVATVAVTREKAIRAFAVYGLKPEQVFKLIDVKGEQDIGINEVLSLRAMFSSIKNGEATVEELLTEAARGSTNFERVANPLQDDIANKDKAKRRKAATAEKASPPLPQDLEPKVSSPAPNNAAAEQAAPPTSDPSPGGAALDGTRLIRRVPPDLKPVERSALASEQSETKLASTKQEPKDGEKSPDFGEQAALSLEDLARQAAAKGEAAFKAFYAARSADEKNRLQAIAEELRGLMQEAGS